MPSLIVQSDFTVTLEKNDPDFIICRDILLKFAELEKCLDYLYIYRITKLSLWNAVALGSNAEQVISQLDLHSKYPIPSKVKDFINEVANLYGLVLLERDCNTPDGFVKLVFKGVHALNWVIPLMN